MLLLTMLLIMAMKEMQSRTIQAKYNMHLVAGLGILGVTLLEVNYF